jgi:hypothetical protein
MKSLPEERLNDLHGDLLSVGNAARRGRARVEAEKAQKSLRSSAGEETKAGRADKQAPKRLHSHPVCGETVARATQPGT